MKNMDNLQDRSIPVVFHQLFSMFLFEVLTAKQPRKILSMLHMEYVLATFLLFCLVLQELLFENNALLRNTKKDVFYLPAHGQHYQYEDVGRLKTFSSFSFLKQGKTITTYKTQNLRKKQSTQPVYLPLNKATCERVATTAAKPIP